MVEITATKLLTCFIVGILFILLGGITDVVFHEVLPRKIEKEVTLTEGSTIYDDWVRNPVTTYFQVWVFDIQNADEVVKSGKKPDLVQRGPYTYKEYRKKYNITYNNNNTVTYRELQWYVFDRDASVGPETDTVTTANVLMMTIANIIRFEYNYITELAELVLDITDDSKLFMKHTVSQVLWGYHDPLLSRVNSILKKYNQSIDSRIGLFNGKNNTDDGVYTVFTERARLGSISDWNGMAELPYWTTRTCRMINGTAGRFFHPDVKEKDTLYVFSSDAYRSFYLKYLGNKQLKGIKLRSFVIPDELFALTEDNEGFCTPYEHCTPYGLMNITLYKENAPIILSQPHFYASDPDVINSVIGLHPTPIVHQTILDVEPMTGIVMNVNKRLQINIYLENVTNIRDTSYLTRGLYLPMAWLNESAGLDDDSAKKFKSQILTPVHVSMAITYTLIVTGAIMAGSVVIFALKNFIVNTIKHTSKGDVSSDENEHSKLIPEENKSAPSRLPDEFKKHKSKRKKKVSLSVAYEDTKTTGEQGTSDKLNHDS